MPADLASTAAFDLPHVVSVHEEVNLAAVKVSFETAERQITVTPEQLLQIPGGGRALHRFRSALWWEIWYNLQGDTIPRLPFIKTAADGVMMFVFGF